jgi:mRNA interferase RelE/StbE
MFIDFKYTKQSLKFFLKHKNIKQKFIDNIKSLLNEETNIDTKLLKGYKDVLRMRINDYRVIYKVQNEKIIIIFVLLVGSRGNIYKNLIKNQKNI